MSMTESTPIAVRLTDIHKSFCPVLANRGASLEVKLFEPLQRAARGGMPTRSCNGAS